MTERMIPVGDAKLCAESFGSPDDPAILLIGGAAASMDYWETEFCSRLAAPGRFVIRYDFRDTGRSTAYPAGSPGYTGDDLVTDALAVLDGYGLAAAHLYGISMGAGIAQALGVEYPARVLSLTLQSTSPTGPLGPGNPDLPPMSAQLAELFSSEDPGPDWTDRDAAISAMVEGLRPFDGTIPPDLAEERAVATLMYDRTTDVAASQTNHWILSGGGLERAQLAGITAPTLVLHGTADPLMPLPHGEALAREIPGARLVPLEGMGHQYPPRAVWDTVVAEVVAHTG
ncbi:alpha/beta fold hydrolase [Jiangella mangrovi]|uniref:Pimeloyl-ACP methyl ester carboxylesterase n=1 Tax=Jiangella mangrovi TaxID=1524084 RepID=A0A7W9GLI6_9ACTN|nr:alpha/beta hydrolase [Jiangella mangrovi]MBB5785896.1 pimeloyl-ACP methyl ester carboxylesterase [Jiangella mangrovi]